MKYITDIVNWGIIGAGDVCEVKSGPAFNKVPDSRLIAIMRRNREKAADYARRHKVPKYYTDARELINDPEINAVYVATPPAFHEEYATAAIRAGKPVYIEKPVTLDAPGCERIIRTAGENNMPVSVAHYRRRLPLFLKIRQLLSDGIIGKVNLITLRTMQSSDRNIIAKTDEFWRVNPSLSGGGLFHDLAPHQLDIMFWLFGVPESFEGYSFNQGKLYQAPDITHFTARFKKNVLLEGLWSFHVHECCNEDRCVIFGEKGKMAFSFFRKPVLEIHTKSGIEKIKLPYPKHVQQPMIRDVVRFFRREMPNPSPLDEALWTMKMMDSTL